MAPQPPTGLVWTLARIRAEHPLVHVWLGTRLMYGAIDATSDLYARVYIRLEHSILCQPFTWESIIAHLTTKDPLVA
jgi:hypothetical protein